ncbi:hypothetical protein [Arthrobacter sp. H20]|uniref:hypothetical protein n=1 Tax=Arthrobacter sp. H20 TaxID=1267981 RepID=UPI00047931A9|nr:hypothetical protein [Arthrobacter sp. H20]
MEIASILTLAAGMALAGSAFAQLVAPGTRMISAVLGLAVALLAIVTLYLGATPGVFLWIIAAAFAVRNFRAAERHKKKVDAGLDPVRHPNVKDLRQLQLPAWAPQVPGIARPGTLGLPAVLTPKGFRGQAPSYPTAAQPYGHSAAPDTRGLRPAPATDRWGKAIPAGSMMDRWGNIVQDEGRAPI